jgi:hypothetical protein
MVAVLNAVTNLGQGFVTAAFPVSAGTNRLLVVVLGTEDDLVADFATVTYGGQALTKAAGAINGAGFSNASSTWYLKEAGIAAAGSTTIAYTTTAAIGELVGFAVSFSGVEQATTIAGVVQLAGGPSTLTAAGIAHGAGAYAIMYCQQGSTGTATWTAPLAQTLGFTSTSGNFASVATAALASAGTLTAQVAVTGNRNAVSGIVISNAVTPPAINIWLPNGSSYINSDDYIPGMGATASKIRIEADNIRWSSSGGCLFSQNHEIAIIRSGSNFNLRIRHQNNVVGFIGGAVVWEFDSFSAEVDLVAATITLLGDGAPLLGSPVSVTVPVAGSSIDPGYNRPRIGVRGNLKTSLPELLDFMIPGDRVGDIRIYIEEIGTPGLVLVREYTMPPSGINVPELVDGFDGTLINATGDGSDWDSDSSEAFNPGFSQVGYITRFDYGGDDNLIARALPNQTVYINQEENFRLRFRVKYVNTPAGNSESFQLQRNLNGAGWVNVTGASTIVQSSPSSHIVDGSNTRDLLSVLLGDSGSFIQANNGVDTANGVAGPVTFSLTEPNEIIDLEYCVKILTTGTSAGNTIQFRVADAIGVALGSYTATPTVIVPPTTTLAVTTGTTLSGRGTIAQLVTAIGNAAIAELVGLRTVHLKATINITGAASALFIPAGWTVSIADQLFALNGARIFCGSMDQYGLDEAATIWCQTTNPDLWVSGAISCDDNNSAWHLVNTSVTLNTNGVLNQASIFGPDQPTALFTALNSNVIILGALGAYYIPNLCCDNLRCTGGAGGEFVNSPISARAFTLKRLGTQGMKIFRADTTVRGLKGLGDSVNILTVDDGKTYTLIDSEFEDTQVAFAADGVNLGDNTYIERQSVNGTYSIAGVAQTGVEYELFDNLHNSLGGGVVDSSGSISEIIATKYTHVQADHGTNYSARLGDYTTPWLFRARLYGTVWQELSLNPNAPISTTAGLPFDPLVTQLESTAESHTGITVVDHGGSPVAWQGLNWSITITCNTTVNPSLTVDDLKHYLHANLAKYSQDFGGKPGTEWHDLLPMSGTETIRRTYGSTLKGVRVVDQSGNPFAGITRMQSDSGVYYSAPLTLAVTVLDSSNLLPIDGARVYLKAASGGPLAVDTEIMNTITNSIGVATVLFTYSSDQPFAGIARKASSPLFYKQSSFQGVILESGIDVTILMIQDS